jgi:hypothetical protein
VAVFFEKSASLHHESAYYLSKTENSALSFQLYFTLFMLDFHFAQLGKVLSNKFVCPEVIIHILKSEWDLLAEG